MSPEAPTAERAFRPSPLPAAASRSSAERDERARAAGYAAGWAAGARAAAQAAAEQARQVAEEAAAGQARREAELREALRTLEQAAAALDARTLPVIHEVRRQVHVAALDLAAAVLGHELSPGPGTARDLLARALDLPAEIGVHTVRVNPADLAHVQALVDAGEHSLPRGARLVADPRLGPGDAISEFPDGYLDAQVGTALDRARLALLEDRA